MEEKLDPDLRFSKGKHVTVVSVLSPNRVVVKQQLNETLNSKYLMLEKELKIEWESRVKFTDEQKPFSGMHVMVRDRTNNEVYRGIVQEELPNLPDMQYAVFMYDHGKIDILTTVNIAPLPGPFKVQLTNRAFVLNVAGICPARLHTDLNDMLTGNPAKQQFVPGGEWSPAAVKFVKKWLDGNEVLVTVYKSFDTAVKLGDIHRRVSHEKTECLSQALIDKKCAVFTKEKADEQLSYEPTIPMDVDVDNQEIPPEDQESQPEEHFGLSLEDLAIASRKRKENRELCDQLNKRSVLFSSCNQTEKGKIEESLKHNTAAKIHMPYDCKSQMGNSLPFDGKVESDLSELMASKLKTDDSNEDNIIKAQLKVKKYTAFAKIEEIGSSILTVANSESVKSCKIPGYGFCEMPTTARKNINVADVPGRTIVRGQEVYPPLESYRKFEFFTHVEKGWENLGLEEGNEVQRSVWPNFVHGHSIFVVGGAKNGKSLSYLVPMCAELLANATYLNKIEGTGPLAVILCSTPSSGIKLEGHGHTLLTSKNLNQMNCVFAHENNKESLHKLRKGAEILITTVDALISCQKKFVPYFMFDRLRYLVFDDAHILFEEKANVTMQIYREYKDYVTKQQRGSQLIVCGNEWTKGIESMYWKLNGRPVVHISTPYQAIVYSGVDLAVHYAPYSTAMIKLADVLKKATGHKKSVVVCGSSDCAEFIHHELQTKYKVYALLAVDYSRETLNSTSMLWESSSDEMQVLVCTDEVLKFMKITDATNLIHYDMPEPADKLQKNRLTLFAMRFACMWRHMRDITIEPEPVPWEKRGSFGKQLTSHIFLTGKEHDLDKIIKNLKKIGVQIPLPIDQHADYIFANKMEKTSICQGVKLFGWCNNTKLASCNKRHYFIKSDVEKTLTLPRSGQVELRVINCINPSAYNCEIVRYYEINSETGKLKLKENYNGKLREYKRLLERHFENKDNRILPDSLKAGTLCAVVLPNGEGIVRGKMLEIMTRTSSNFPASVRISCFDIGEKVIRNVNEHIFKLPSHIADLPTLCVDVILSGVVPPNNDKEYTDKQIRSARELTESQIYLGRIVCSIGNTIWVNPLVDMKRDAKGNTVISDSVRQQIVRDRIAVIKHDYEKVLMNLCEQAEYPMEEFKNRPTLQNDSEFIATFFQKVDCYNWAHLPVSSISCPEENLVSIVYIKNPWLVYGNIVNFINITDDLISDINEDTNNLIETAYQDYYEKFKDYYEVGLVVLAKQPDFEKWHRAIITEKINNDDEILFNVFYVDFGDTMEQLTSEDLFPIKKEFVNKIPFQAIAFNASHVTPKECPENSSDLQWCSESFDFLENLLIPDGVSSDANIVVLSKDPASESSAVLCRYYCALIFPKADSTAAKHGDEVGESLVNKGFAEFTRIGQKNLESVKTALLDKYNAIFNQKQALDIDDDVSEDDLDLATAVTNSTLKDEKAYPAGYFDDECFDVYVPSIENTLSTFGINPSEILPPKSVDPSCSTKLTDAPVDSGKDENTSNTKKEQNQSGSPSSRLVAYPSTEEPGLKHPKTYWSQTEDQIQLIVELPDITEYTFNLEKNRSISFRTTKPPNYGFDVVAFLALQNPEEFVTGQYFRVKFQKRQRGTMWLGFHKDYRSLKLPWLKEKLTLNPDNDDSDDENRRNSLIPVEFDKMFPGSETDSEDDDDLEDFDEDDFIRADLSRDKFQRPPLPM